jgi:ankyrin repeat protein
LIAGGADLKATNADGLTATSIAIVNARFDLAKELLDLGADPNDGSLFFAVDMHDRTTDMRAEDSTRMQPDHPNQLTSLTLVKALLDLNADVNKPFTGSLHSTSMCCLPNINSSPFYRAAVAGDVEVLKLLLAKGAQIEWSPAGAKPKDGKKAAPGANASAGQTPLMAVMKSGKGPPISGGPGYTRNGPPVWREPGDRDAVEAVKLLLAAGANPNAKAADGSMPLHQAVQAKQVPLIQALAAAGAKLDAVNKDNKTPLLLAEALPTEPPKDTGAPVVDRGHVDSRADVIAALRELMHLGPNDPAPQPPPPPVQTSKKAPADKGDKAEKEPVATEQ